MSPNKEFIAAAIEQAKARHLRLLPGDCVAHESDPIAYRLDRVVNGVAYVSAGDVAKTFPFNEIFDLNLGKKIAGQLKADARIEEIKASWPTQYYSEN